MNEHEEKMIDAFIVREKRARYKAMLGDSRKRAQATARLNHFRDLDERYATWLPSNAPIEQMLRQAGSPESVLVISSTQELDGQSMTLEEAILRTFFDGWGAIISCVPGQLAYYHDEEGERRAILKRQPSP